MVSAALPRRRSTFAGWRVPPSQAVTQISNSRSGYRRTDAGTASMSRSAMAALPARSGYPTSPMPSRGDMRLPQRMMARLAPPIGAATFIGHPDVLKDFGYRALKVTTDNSKAIINRFTGKNPSYSYFSGCSDGGREALMEAQRYPNDFDGIIVGSPANDLVGLGASFLWNMQALFAGPRTHGVPDAYVPTTRSYCSASWRFQNVLEKMAAFDRYVPQRSNDLPF